MPRAQMNICTIIAKNYVAQALVLAESFRRHHPEGTCTVLVVDEFEGHIDPGEVPFELVGIDSIGLPERERSRMAASYDVLELSTAVKPWLLRYLLERPGCDVVTYLDPDIWILDDLEEVERLAQRHGLVLTPHFTAPLPRDGLKPGEEDILSSGAYNLGFISLAAGSATEGLLDWWSEHLLRDCLVDPDNGFFVDQRWIDLAPGIYPDLHLLRDPGYNLAYWNLPTRELSFEADRYLVDGRPLRFFHFSGFDPLRPGELSRHQNRIELSDSQALSRICDAYAAEVLEAGYEEARTWPYDWDFIPGGLRLDRYSRRLYRRAVSESALNGSIYDKSEAKRVIAYLSEPDQEAAKGSGVTRYLGEIRRSREDLRHAFPDIGGPDATRFLDWIRENADTLEIPSALRPADLAAPASNGDRGRPSDIGGVNLAGDFCSELGTSEAARLIASAMSEVEIATARIDTPLTAEEMPQKLSLLPEEKIPFGVNLICANADMIPEFAAAVDPAFFANRYSIALWFWEASRFPAQWRHAFDPLDEVWVATKYVADAIQPSSPIPVEMVRNPVAPAPPERIDRAALGMPDDFCFLFIFDYRSILKRKNPLGLIDSFSQAFDPGSGASLVVKSIGGETHPEDATLLRVAASSHPDVHLIESTLSAGAKNAMIANCDCYISLHRSEGFGHTMAEAMYFGKPVIATGYSGNLDFMTDENSYLVPHALAQVGDGALPYPPDATWAEPDLGAATLLMRRVHDNRQEAAAKGEQGAADIRRTHSLEATGRIIEARLKQISERNGDGGHAPRQEAPQGDAPTPDAPQSHEIARTQPDAPEATAGAGHGMSQLRHLLQFEEAPPRPDGGRIRHATKRLYLLLLRPYIAYQRRINDGAAQAIDDVRVELARRSAAIEQQQRVELQRLESTVAELRTGITAKLDSALEAQALEATARSEANAVSLQQLGEELQAIRVATQAIQAAGSEDLKASRDELQQRQEAVSQELARSVRELRAALMQELLAVEGIAGRASESVETVSPALRDLEARVSASEVLAEASAAPPFMADDRFGPEEHGGLGTVFGFASPLEEDGAGPYKGFEDLFRGSEEMIRDRQRTYIDLVSGFAPVLDVGCGRGEFLDLLQAAQIEHQGIDIDPGMVARCCEKGHADVVLTDAVGHLEELSAGALGTIFSAQVIEHLEFEYLQGFLARSLEVLRPGGLFIAETVNPHSPRALKAFWVDPSHQRPLFPETVLSLCQLAGYASAFVFCPNGSGEYEQDRLVEGEYAVVARAPERHAGVKPE